MLKKLIFLGILITAFGLSACEREGPAERAGKKVDESVEKAGEKIEDAGEKVKEKAD